MRKSKEPRSGKAAGHTPKPKTERHQDTMLAQPTAAQVREFQVQYLLDRINDIEQRVRRLERLYVRSLDAEPDAQKQDQSGEDLETAGNIVCLPGVKLSDVLHDGGQP
jgi:hypothetical protein